jgi:hypothetical protein
MASLKNLILAHHQGMIGAPCAGGQLTDRADFVQMGR